MPILFAMLVDAAISVTNTIALHSEVSLVPLSLNPRLFQAKLFESCHHQKLEMRMGSYVQPNVITQITDAFIMF